MIGFPVIGLGVSAILAIPPAKPYQRNPLKWLCSRAVEAILEAILTLSNVHHSLKLPDEWCNAAV